VGSGNKEADQIDGLFLNVKRASYMFNPSAKKFRSSCSVNLTLEILVAHFVSQGGVQNCRFGSSAGKGHKDTKNN
jgi:hypothetical protein